MNASSRRNVLLLGFLLVALLFSLNVFPQHAALQGDQQHLQIQRSEAGGGSAANSAAPPSPPPSVVAICVFGLVKNVDPVVAQAYRRHLMEPLWRAGLSTSTMLVSNALDGFSNPRNDEQPNNGVELNQDKGVALLRQMMMIDPGGGSNKSNSAFAGVTSSFESHLVRTEEADAWIGPLAPYMRHGHNWEQQHANLSMHYFLRQQFTLHKLAYHLTESVDTPPEHRFCGMIFVRPDLMFFDSADVAMLRFVAPRCDEALAASAGEDAAEAGMLRPRSHPNPRRNPLDDDEEAGLTTAVATDARNGQQKPRRRKSGKSLAHADAVPPRIAIPSYFMWYDTGFIDKFAMADVRAGLLYVRRAAAVRDYASQKQLHAETFLRDHLCGNGVEVHLTRHPRVARWRLFGLHQPDRVSELKDLSRRNELRWMDPKSHRGRFAPGRRECPQDMWRKAGDAL